ncbi:PIR protein [Plasmodium ovale]|uniref:PIR Superfamily Protein n=2 Tax=Plasmodium ovale TaxID=36330 RepID=A0A1A8WMM7_PLAOA|nr:PIR Superfamily Protein [Plasmodium ovale curtisi]SBT83615.1 PIR protein [Plasmodium ovale]
MEKNIQLSDFPSKKFEDLKKRINYELLQGYQKKTTTKEHIDHWIDEFKSKIDEYSRENSLKELIKNDKDCKDFNYIIEQIKQKIYSLVNGPGEQHMIKERIKQWRENYFRINTDLTCKENDIYIKPQLKNLYDFCEDNIFIKEKLTEIKQSDKCQIIIDDISKRKDELKPKKDMFFRQITSTKINDIQCNPTILDNQFPFFKCTPRAEPNAIITNGEHVNSRESGEKLLPELHFTSGELPGGEQISPTIRGQTDANSNSSSNAIGIVSLPILGVLVSSFLLYRFTPLGTKFLGYFLNKADIPLNQEGETTDQMLFNTSNLSDTYTENIQYNLTYQKT